MIPIGRNQQIGQLVGDVVLADKRVRQQRPEHPLPPTLDSSVQRQLLVRGNVGNETGEERINRSQHLRLRTLSVDPRRYLGRLDDWKKRVERAGATEWRVINDLERLDSILARS